MSERTYILEQANKAQREAEDPSRSSFVSANAGSGKTAILANRIARLLYRGADPSHILCLTFTKAAAGEIADRVYRLLSSWVLLDDKDLSQRLLSLEEGVDLGPGALSRARRLFAAAIDAPGGLKVQTLHGFSASILRRFPIEADVPIGFREIDEPESVGFVRRAYEKVALQSPDLLRALRPFYGIDTLCIWAYKYPNNFKDTPTQVDFQKALGLSITSFEDTRRNFLNTLPKNWEELGNQTFTRKDHVDGWRLFVQTLKAPDPDFTENLFQNFLFTKDLRPASYYMKENERGSNVKSDAAFDFIQALVKLGYSWFEDQFFGRLWLLNRFEIKLIAAYQEIKRHHAILDYNDLLTKCERLLSAKDRLNWVLYQLDSQIEHILVDEAQDTNAQQWRIVDSLLRFDEGQQDRTIFVVGDHKQAIFGFQGSDPDIFMKKLAEYKEALAGGKSTLFQGRMETSFRSSPLILDFVDHLFSKNQNDLSQGLGGAFTHQAAFENMPGQIQIGPIFSRDQKEHNNSTISRLYNDQLIKNDPEIDLAEHIAQMIANEIKMEKPIWDRGQDGVIRPRPVRPGDYLILVSKRRTFYTQVQNALRQKSVPIAGVDKLDMSSELSVLDVMSALLVCAYAFDDLALGRFLRSPLGGYDEAALFDLAYSRQGTLFEALQQRVHDDSRAKGAYEILSFLRKNADYELPSDLLRIFFARFDVESRLRARLGSAVPDALGILVELAHKYETVNIPSLAGFVSWFQQEDLKYKRELVDDANAVRVMTVHGAKGLESPIVILPSIDTESDRDTKFSLENDLFVPISRKNTPPPTLQFLPNYKRDEEKNRLLYVGLTRARSRLVLCGVTKNKDSSTQMLFKSYQDAAADLGQKDSYVFVEQGEECILSFGEKEAVFENSIPKKAVTRFYPPVIIPAVNQDKSIALSDLLPEFEDSADLVGRGAEFGANFHKLAEYWPSLDEKERRDLAENLFAPEQQNSVLIEIETLFKAYPALLAPTTLHEVEVGVMLGNTTVTGRIDAVIFHEDRIEIIDYKTQITKKENPEIPNVYCMQLGFYARALAQAFPEKPIYASILWTYRALKSTRSPAELSLAADNLFMKMNVKEAQPLEKHQNIPS